MKKLLFLFLTLILVSCSLIKKEYDLQVEISSFEDLKLYEYITSDYDTEECFCSPFRYGAGFPLRITNGKDTILVIEFSSIRELDLQYVAKYNQGETLMYSIVKNNHVVKVNEEVYQTYLKNKIIEDEKIKSVYKKENLLGLCRKYLDEDQGLCIKENLSLKEKNYLYYLFFKHHIYFFHECHYGYNLIFPYKRNLPEEFKD